MRRAVKRRIDVVPCCRRRRIFLLPLFVLAALFLTHAMQATLSEDNALAAGIRNGGQSASSAARPESKPVSVVIEGTVKEGETIRCLLGGLLSPQEISLLASQSRDVFPLREIREGRPYLVRTLDERFQSFEYEIDSEEKLVIRAEANGFVLLREPIAHQVDTVIVCGSITTHLFEAAGQIGETPVLVMKLVEIFGFDVDFVLDVRAGDTFKAIVEKRYRNGEFSGYGRILAAEFVNEGKAYQGFLFENRDGYPEYYDAKGRSLRRTFLKTPLDYARVSSGFSCIRFHPIKQDWLPHPAIDYAAPEGTPVRTVGDGVVAETGFDNAGGKFVKVRHDSEYETLYLHLSHFSKGLEKGSDVRQGQVIGYVGNTGMSTGPHLDFRMKKNGRYVNPRKIIAPASAPVPRERIEAFRDVIQPLRTQLDAAKIPATMETSGKTAESLEYERDRERADASARGALGGL